MRTAEAVLIDTSSWIEALRYTGRSDIREKVFHLITEGQAAWCDIVAVELWNGARGDYEKQKLSELEREIICLQTTQEVWQMARDLARKCRKEGQTVPTVDLVVAASALHYGVEIEHCDSHINAILKVSVPKKKG